MQHCAYSRLLFVLHRLYMNLFKQQDRHSVSFVWTQTHVTHSHTSASCVATCGPSLFSSSQSLGSLKLNVLHFLPLIYRISLIHLWRVWKSESQSSDHFASSREITDSFISSLRTFLGTLTIQYGVVLSTSVW